jgi:hypothetical protein
MGHPSVRIPGTDRILIKPQHSLRLKSQDRNASSPPLAFRSLQFLASPRGEPAHVYRPFTGGNTGHIVVVGCSAWDQLKRTAFRG